MWVLSVFATLQHACVVCTNLSTCPCMELKRYWRCPILRPFLLLLHAFAMDVGLQIPDKAATVTLVHLQSSILTLVAPQCIQMSQFSWNAGQNTQNLSAWFPSKFKCNWQNFINSCDLAWWLDNGAHGNHGNELTRLRPAILLACNVYCCHLARLRPASTS